MQRYVVSFYWGVPGEEFFSVGIFVSGTRSSLIDDAKVALSRWPRTAGEKFFPVEPKAVKARIATALWVDFILYAAWLFIVQSFNAAKIGGFAFTGGAGEIYFPQEIRTAPLDRGKFPSGPFPYAHAHARSFIIFHARARTRIRGFIFPGGPCIGGNLYLCVNNQTNQ